MPEWFSKLIKKEFWFYFLSCTWGITLSFIGAIGSIPFLFFIALTDNTAMIDHKGHCIYFILGKGWGGLNLGPFCFVSKTAKIRTMAHEHGHALQNCLLGPFIVPFCICSGIRYNYRNIREKLNKPCKTSYDDFWFEGQASNWGIEFFNDNVKDI